MLNSDIETYSRSRYNASSDTFFSSAEIMYYIYKAQLDVAIECQIIEKLNTAIPSVSGTQSYAYPTNAEAIKRITYNGQKLQKITFREDDSLTLNNATSTLSGTPAFYYEWNKRVYLRPIPDTSSLNIIMYTYNSPTVPIASGTPEIPDIFHMDLLDPVNMEMAAKDQNWVAHDKFRARWLESISKIKRWSHKKKRTDSNTVVQDEDSLATTIQGPV